MGRAVFHDSLDSLGGIGFFHDWLVFTTIIELNGCTSGINILADIVSRIEDSTSSHIFNSPCDGSVIMLRFFFCLGKPKWNDCHGVWKSNVCDGGEHTISSPCIHDHGSQSLIFQT